MKLFKVQKVGNLFLDLKFAIFLLGIIAFASSFGSVIEQDEVNSFYEENYSVPIYGVFDSKFILFLGLDHVYRTWWFLSLLCLLAISLIACTLTRQFPIVTNSKKSFFKKESKSYSVFPFLAKMKNFFFLNEIFVGKIANQNFFLYQTKNFLYAYKGLIGRISPILVHFSLILILGGSFLGSFQNFKAQEIFPKGEISHIQNPLKVGWFANLPDVTVRTNDFWVEYETSNRIHQFYSNLSILDDRGNELSQQTVSVNHPLRYKNLDFYQSDWNILGIRIAVPTTLTTRTTRIYEYPVYSLKKDSKLWITCFEVNNKTYAIILDQFQERFFLYDQTGSFLKAFHFNEVLFENDSIPRIIEVIASTGFLIKSDQSIPIIYLGFAGLMITTLVSYFPYSQLWVKNSPQFVWVGSLTNRGKLQVEIEFENLVREIENQEIFSRMA